MPSLHVHFLPSQVQPDSLHGAAAVVVDLLRASTTIVRALDAGAAGVVPCLEPDDAVATRSQLIAVGARDESLLLGGERGGVRIPGFDLGNSPAECTRERLNGRTLIFTTTNGTRALFTARRNGAASVLVGCFNNLGAVVAHLAARPVPVHVIAAGTNGDVSQEDVLCAGALAVALHGRGWFFGDDDRARIAADLWRFAVGNPSGPGSVLDMLSHSRGGRNLLAIGLGDDIAECASLDRCGIVPELVGDTLRPTR